VRAQSVSTVLATQELPEVPAGRHWAVRDDHSAGGQPHSHAGGFLYVASGESTARYDDGQEVSLREGEAVWVREGAAHTHRAASGAQLWSFTLDTQAEAEASPPLFTTAELRGFRQGPHLAQIVDQTYAPAGEPQSETPPHRHFGPEAVYFRNGRWELNYSGALIILPGGAGYVVEPLIPLQLRNTSSEPGRLFNLGLVPAGLPQGEPLPPERLR
jgi:quercetin dioxygenase-like cupin family protein